MASLFLLKLSIRAHHPKIYHNLSLIATMSYGTIQRRALSNTTNTTEATKYILLQTKQLKQDVTQLQNENKELKSHISNCSKLSLDMRRSLHWVLKIGNLKRSIDFYDKVCNMKILRHEEFNTSCNAKCNGDFGDRPWSKTMIGYGDEREYFALELTYNYGIKGYQRGNDLKYIGLNITETGLNNAIDLGYKVSPFNDKIYDIIGSDDINHRCTISNNNDIRFNSIALNCRNIENSYKYWCGILNMECIKLQHDKYMMAQYGESIPLEFYQLDDGTVFDHGKAEGRIAFSTEIENGVNILYDYYEYVSKDNYGKYIVHTKPVTLKTAGKADCDVVILQDVDEYEICFVGKDGFYELCSSENNVVNIDWDQRKENGADQDKGQFIK